MTTIYTFKQLFVSHGIDIAVHLHKTDKITPPVEYKFHGTPYVCRYVSMGSDDIPGLALYTPKY